MPNESDPVLQFSDRIIPFLGTKLVGALISDEACLLAEDGTTTATTIYDDDYDDTSRTQKKLEDLLDSKGPKTHTKSQDCLQNGQSGGSPVGKENRKPELL